MSTLAAIVVFVLIAVFVVSAKAYNLWDSRGNYLYKPRSDRDDAENNPPSNPLL